MSKRLQVLLDDAEFRELQRMAKRQRLTVPQLVRRAVISLHRVQLLQDPARKLAVVRKATRHAYPTGDVASMLAEIERN